MVCVVLSYVVVLVVSQYRQRVLVTVVLLRLAMTCLLTLCFEDNTPTHNTLHHADDHDAHHHPHHLQSDLQQEVEEDLELHQPDLQQEEEVKQYSSSYLQRDLEEDQATLHLEPEVQQETEGQDHDEEKQMMEEMEGRAEEEEERDEEVEEESRVLEENVREIVSCVEEEEEPEGERHHSLTQDEEEPQEERDESDVNQADVEDADDDGDGELLEDEVMAVDGDLTVHHQKKTVIAENEDCEYASEGDYETGGKGTTSESPPPEGSTCDREWEVERKRSVKHVEVVEGGRLAHEEEDQESINIDHYDDDVFYTPVEEQSESGTNNGKEKVKEASKDTLNEDNVPKTDYCNNEWENRVMTSQSDSGDDKTEHVERGDKFIVITEEESDEVLQTEKKRNLDQKNKESRNGTCKEKLSVGLKTCNVMSNEEIAAAISWIRDLPPPLSGPKCTCKVPGTPPWKLARPCKLPEPLAAPSDSVPQPHDPVAAPPEPPPAAYATTLASVNHQIVTVQLRRPRSATVTKEAGSRTKDDCCDRQHVFCRSGRSLESKWESLCTTKTCVRGATPEETSKSVRVLAAEEPAMLRTNAENLREKRRIFRSWSFFGAKSPQDDLTRSLHGFTTTPSSSVGSSSSSVSSPICSSSTFATLITPRRWSRLLEQKRRSFQSCIFPDAYSPSIGGKLSARVKSESDVAPRKHSVSHEPIINIKPQSLSKTFNEKRKSVTSCIFPDTVNEDCTPYTRVKEEPDQKPVSRLKTGKSESPPKTKSNWRFRKFSSNGDIPGWRDSSVNNTCGVQLESSSSESQITSLESQLINSKLQTIESESKIRRNLSRTKRPKSLIIIPETQTVRVDPNINRPETAVKRPESLVVPSCVRVPKRDPRLTPPQPPEISCDLRSQSQGRLSAIDPREGPCYIHRSLSHILTQSHSESSQSIGRTPLIDLNSIVLRSPATKPKKRRKSARSWSYNEKMMEVSPEGVLYQTEGRSRRSGAWAPHVLRPRSLYPRDSSAEPSPTSNTVIFPWRRGEHSRGSGRSSPAAYDVTNQSPSSSPFYSHSPTCTLPEESTNGTCEIPSDTKRKDGVWWRGRGGVSRTTRREKASSSPVFRRASLSHSEWDIRRPWSHMYSEREAAKLSQSVCRLAMTSGEDGGMAVEVVQEGEEGPRSLPYMPSTMQASSEGMFQKFKKSLSLRLAKKGSRSESPVAGSQSAPVGHSSIESSQIESSQTLPRRRGSISRDDDNKSSFLFGHPLFRSSKERRRARLKDARSSKCNSGDSGDSGIELVVGCGQMTALDMTGHTPPDLHTSNNYIHPAFVASLADDGGSGLREVNPRAVRRAHSDVGGTGGRSCLHYSRQLSTPQPIKIRPAHRLPQHTASLHRSKSLKRSKGSSHLRRSVSQPLDLDRPYETPTSTLRKCRSPTNTQNRRQRRPSAGNILNEDTTTSEDEIGISDSEDFRTDLKRSLEEDDDMIVYAEALWDHVTLDSEELVFKAGDLITVIDSSDKDWWWGRISHRAGWFPAAFVRILVNQEDHQDSRSLDDMRILGPARKLSVSGLSHDQIRTNVINEIISTERDFVKHLRDVVKGYLRQVRKRPDMFSDERISTIFGNMEALYQFQSNFLRELEMCIDWQDPHKSCIGAAFIRNREKFEIYSEYCNNHPAAMSSLQELYQDQKYIHFFEACRLLQEMIDISLDGFLLTPVQKICKYPLQLQELLKYTKSEHPDHTSVQGALEAMRDVALLVNERKRRMECLEKIASWQITVEGWEGSELLEDSSQLIYQGEVTKGVGGSWPKEVTLFLFDHQLVYCKRDLLKRNTFVYRGRLNLDMCEIVDLPDGKDSSLNISVHNAWKIHSLEKNKWYVFSSKIVNEKQKWMEAFRRERELVAADENAGFVVAEKAKHLAKVAARNQRNRPKRPRSLWFSFGGHKKGRGSGRTVTQIQHHPV